MHNRNPHDPWTPDYGDDPEWYINAEGRRYKAKPKPQAEGPLRVGIPVLDYLNANDWKRQNGPKPTTRREKRHARFDRFWDGIVTSIVLAMCATGIAGALVVGGFLEMPDLPAKKPAPVTVEAPTSSECGR